MNDLNGLDWSAPSTNSTSSKGVPAATGNYFPSLRPTPSPQASGRSSPFATQPLSAQASGAIPRPNPIPGSSKPTSADSFSNLVSFGSAKTATLTLQQQQEKLLAEKRAQEEERRKREQGHYGSSQFWDGLGAKGPNSNGRGMNASSHNGTPLSFSGNPSPFAPRDKVLTPVSMPAVSTPDDNDDDLFAAFNADTKVDNASHYPPPKAPTPEKAVDLSQAKAWEQPTTSLDLDDDDDDPFGLGTMKPTSTPAGATSTNNNDDDDDFLGDLGKPVDQVRQPSPQSQPRSARTTASRPAAVESEDPWDRAVAELVEMGFAPEQAQQALTESGAGLDVQAAVSWILNEAHRKSKQKEPDRSSSRPLRGPRGDAPPDRRANASPAWMREEAGNGLPKRGESQSPAITEDLSKAAAAMGSNLFKTANSLWKTSQKKMQQAVAELQQDGTGDSSQPKWMREVEPDRPENRAGPASRGRPAREPAKPSSNVTDEALMLEGGGRPPPRKSRPRTTEPRFAASNSSRDASPALPSRPKDNASPIPRWQQSASPDPRSRLSKQVVEDQSAQAYVSPSRRKKAATTPQAVASEPDLLFSGSPSAGPKSTSSPRTTPISQSSRSAPLSKPITPRPKAPLRNIPAVSSIALQSSHQHRQAGTAHFKRGDYASAHASYSSSLSALPPSHPLTIILLCNRSLTGLKTGSPKDAVQDADAAISLVGPSHGEDETIDVAGEKKNMKEFWGKALTRKAEALEQMERWKEAAAVWQECVAAGVGGASAIQGRQRCEKATAPKPAPTSRAATPARTTPKPRPAARSALASLSAGSADSEAVTRLRQANAAADKADDEKFALADSVDARISAWRDGKRDNLRALIGSLDSVLWEGSGWKKVGMAELVLTNKVKIHYMKAIGKCHPDKLPQDATTEIKLIAATVFSTLNESWDKFKEQNGM